jgi:hypothetical protein
MNTKKTNETIYSREIHDLISVGQLCRDYGRKAVRSDWNPNTPRLTQEERDIVRESLDERLDIGTVELECSFAASERQEHTGEDSSKSIPRGVQLPLGGRVVEHSPGKGEECMSVKEKNGTIVRIDDRAGFGYVWEEGSTQQYIFNFFKVPGYYGQSAGRLNLRIGSRVRFQVEDEIVKSLVPL